MFPFSLKIRSISVNAMSDVPSISFDDFLSTCLSPFISNWRRAPAEKVPDFEISLLFFGFGLEIFLISVMRSSVPRPRESSPLTLDVSIVWRPALNIPGKVGYRGLLPPLSIVSKQGRAHSRISLFPLSTARCTTIRSVSIVSSIVTTPLIRGISSISAR